MSTTDGQSPGSVLRELRLAKGWTQVKLAVRANVAPGTIVNAERDRRQPQPLVQAAIARALGVERQEIWPEPADRAAIG